MLARLLFTAAAAMALGASAAHAAPGCSPKGATTLAANRVAKLYTLSGGDRLYGCVRRTGRPKLLVNREGDGIYTSFGYGHVTLSGAMAGYSERATDVSCKADCPPDYQPTKEFVVVTDLRARTTRSLQATATAVAVSATGGLAWTQGTPAGSELHYSPSGRVDTLVDSGAIDRLSFCGRQLLWRNAGQGRWIDG